MFSPREGGKVLYSQGILNFLFSHFKFPTQGSSAGAKCPFPEGDNLMILMLYPLTIMCISSSFDDCVPVEPIVILLSIDNDTVADAETV